MGKESNILKSEKKKERNYPHLAKQLKNYEKYRKIYHLYFQKSHFYLLNNNSHLIISEKLSPKSFNKLMYGSIRTRG